MRSGRVIAAKLLRRQDDEGCRRHARRLFDRMGNLAGADGFEVWDGPRCVLRFSALSIASWPPTPV
jgi:hypothetical protein